MDKAKECYRNDETHPLNRYFPFMMDIIICEMADGYFSSAKPDDSAELHLWDTFIKREPGDHSIALVIQRAMSLFLLRYP